MAELAGEGKMLQELFGPAGENLNREKYEFLQAGIDRISGDVTPDEKLVLGLIRKSALKLERQLYPNPVLRVLHRLKNLVYDRPLQRIRERRLNERNVERVSSEFNRLGIDPGNLDLGRKLAAEKRNLDIEILSPYAAGNYTVKLNLERDNFGHYQMPGYTASFKDLMNPENSRSYTFASELGINAREAINLLQGRAVMKYDQIGDYQRGGKWVQLDFSNLGADGKPVLRETGAEHEFNVRHEAIRLAVALGKPELAGAKALNELERGNQVVLKQVSGNVIYLEANPLAKEITLKDMRGERLPLEKAVKDWKKSIAVKKEIKLAKSRSKQQVQGQSIGIS